MKIVDLIKELESYDPESVVVLWSDAEGNSYSPVESIFSAVYVPESTWNGWLWPDDQDDDCAAPVDGVDAVVIVPVN